MERSTNPVAEHKRSRGRKRFTMAEYAEAKARTRRLQEAAVGDGPVSDALAGVGRMQEGPADRGRGSAPSETRRIIRVPMETQQRSESRTNGARAARIVESSQLLGIEAVLPAHQNSGPSDQSLTRAVTRPLDSAAERCALNSEMTAESGAAEASTTAAPVPRSTATRRSSGAADTDSSVLRAVMPSGNIAPEAKDLAQMDDVAPSDCTALRERKVAFNTSTSDERRAVPRPVPGSTADNDGCHANAAVIIMDGADENMQVFDDAASRHTSDAADDSRQGDVGGNVSPDARTPTATAAAIPVAVTNSVIAPATPLDGEKGLTGVIQGFPVESSMTPVVADSTAGPGRKGDLLDVGVTSDIALLDSACTFKLDSLLRKMPVDSSSPLSSTGAGDLVGNPSLTDDPKANAAATAPSHCDGMPIVAEAQPVRRHRGRPPGSGKGTRNYSDALSRPTTKAASASGKRARQKTGRVQNAQIAGNPSCVPIREDNSESAGASGRTTGEPHANSVSRGITGPTEHAREKRGGSRRAIGIANAGVEGESAQLGTRKRRRAIDVDALDLETILGRNLDDYARKQEYHRLLHRQKEQFDKARAERMVSRKRLVGDAKGIVSSVENRTDIAATPGPVIRRPDSISALSEPCAIERTTLLQRDVDGNDKRASAMNISSTQQEPQTTLNVNEPERTSIVDESGQNQVQNDSNKVSSLSGCDKEVAHSVAPDEVACEGNNVADLGAQPLFATSGDSGTIAPLENEFAVDGL